MALIEGGVFPDYEYREFPKAIETPAGVVVVETAEEEAALAEPKAEPAAEAPADIEPEAEGEPEHPAPTPDEA
jgi:hypothetical protein